MTCYNSLLPLPYTLNMQLLVNLCVSVSVYVTEYVCVRCQRSKILLTSSTVHGNTTRLYKKKKKEKATKVKSLVMIFPNALHTLDKLLYVHTFFPSKKGRN